MRRFEPKAASGYMDAPQSVLARGHALRGPLLASNLMRSATCGCTILSGVYRFLRRKCVSEGVILPARR
eukprot:g4377.t1